MTHAEAEKVFTLMRRHWPALANPAFRIFARRKDKAFGMVCGNPAQLRNAANWSEADGWNLYVQMNPSAPLNGTRSSADEIDFWCWFLIDIDPLANYEGIPNPLAALDKVDAILRNYIGEKTLHRYVIDSGRGMQAWYPLYPVAVTERKMFRTEPLARDFELEDTLIGVQEYAIKEAAPRAMGYWLNLLRERLDIVGNEGCMVDLCARDLPRVMRMPYTINVKTGRRGDLLEEATDNNYALADKLLKYAPYGVWKPVEVVSLPGVDGSTPWQVFIPHMTRAGRLFITEGAEEGGRHHAAVAAARSLRDLGCSAEQAKLALIEGGKMCFPKFEANEVEVIIVRNFK
jgi:hypothetical protein